MNFLRNSRFIRSLSLKTSINDRSPFVSGQLLNLKRGAVARCGGMQSHFLSTMVDTSELECDELVDGSKAKEKDNALHIAIRQLASEFGRESMLSLSNFFNPRCSAVISTGSLKLDLALGVGGLPKGRIVEIYGKEASGKTTLALHVIKEAQKLGGYCAYLDAENAMDPTLAESIGVNTENLLISCPDSAENMLCVVDKLTKSGSLDVIVVDSVAALVPQCELDGDIAAAEHGGVLSKVMTKALRRIHSSLCRSKTLIIFLNQVRYNPNSNKGLGQKGEVTCGGNALGFYAAVRMRISRTGLLSTSNKVNGIGICVQVLKNKMASPMTSAQLGIKFGRGVQLESEVLELGIEHGLILKEGNSYFIEGEVFDSAQAGERFLAENEVVLDKLVMDLRTELFDKSS